jgi:hypothetical protein
MEGTFTWVSQISVYRRIQQPLDHAVSMEDVMPSREASELSAGMENVAFIDHSHLFCLITDILECKASALHISWRRRSAFGAP